MSQCSYEANNKSDNDFDCVSAKQSRGNSIEPPKHMGIDDRLVNTDIKSQASSSQFNIHRNRNAGLPVEHSPD